MKGNNLAERTGYHDHARLPRRALLAATAAEVSVVEYMNMRGDVTEKHPDKAVSDEDARVLTPGDAPCHWADRADRDEQRETENHGGC